MQFHVRKGYYGWRVAGAAFLLALIGLGLGFHGPGIYLQAVREARGWPLATVSAAVTLHFLTGALVVAHLPALHRHWGPVAVTRAGAALLAAGILGWALAREPWQLLAAAAVSGGAWVTLGIAAVNAFVSPWFERDRPAALALAYNGANLGGVVVPPLLVAAIGILGFAGAVAVLGLGATAAAWLLAGRYLSATPAAMGLAPDGVAAARATGADASPPPLPGAMLWRDRRFLTLSAGMALGLFAQIGLTVHLFSILSPALGDGLASLAVASVTFMAIVGRSLLAPLLAKTADRRVVAAASYALQALGCLLLTVADGGVAMLFAGVALFGLGFGNGTWLPPLIAQKEFATHEVGRVVALAVALSQGLYALAPVAFGLLREWAPGGATGLFIAVILFQALAAAAFLAGRTRSSA